MEIDDISTSLEDHEHPINTLKISFPYSYAYETVPLNWHDIWIAIHHGFLTYDSAIIHAHEELTSLQNSSNDVIQLALLLYEDNVFEHSIHPYIDSLAKEVSKRERDMSQSKIMYILLKWVYDHRDKYSDPLEIVEFIYDDFNFPKLIRPFVRHLPMLENNLGTVEENTKRMYEYWNAFLAEQKKVWRK